MSTLKKGTSKLNATELVAKSLYIESRMDGNPDFPSPEPKLSDVTAAREALEASITLATDGGRSAHAQKRRDQLALRALLDRLAGHVVSVADGDEVMIRNAGWEVRRRTVPVGPLTPPTDVLARISSFTGRILLRWQAVPNAYTYQVYINDTDPADANAWQLTGVSSRAKHQVDGLTPGRFYWFRVNAVGSTGAGPLSDVARCMAA